MSSAQPWPPNSSKRPDARCAVPAAWPSVAQVAITREELMAAWVALMFRPAHSRFSMFREYRQRYGMPNGLGAGWKIVGSPGQFIPPGWWSSMVQPP